MRLTLILALTAALASFAAEAQEESVSFSVGGDSFHAGKNAEFDGSAEDLFMAGNILGSRGQVAGTAHLAGRRIILGGDVGQDVYAAGMNVSVEADVGGDVTAAGYDVEISGDVGGKVRASGATVTLTGNVGGYALLAGEVVVVEGAVGGDLIVTADEVKFGPEAVVSGVLTLYEEKVGETDVPGQVVPEDRLQRREIDEAARDGAVPFRPPSMWDMIGGFMGGVLFITVLAAVAGASLPAQLAALRAQILSAPWRSLWFGFLTQSMLTGSAIVLAFTLVGLLVMPAIFVAAGLLGLAGYVVGAYAVGVWLTGLLGRQIPKTLGERVIAAAAGAFVAGLVVLIPILGWLALLALTLIGIGALSLVLFRPGFFVRA